MEPSEKSKLNWQRLLITLGIVLFAVLIVGGTTWYVMDKSAKEVQTANEKTLVELQKQIDELKNTSSEEAVVKKTEDSATVVAGPEKIIQYFEEAKIQRNYAQAVKYVTSNVINAYAAQVEGSDQTSGDVFLYQIVEGNHTLKYSLVDSAYINPTTFQATIREVTSETPCPEVSEGPCFDHFDIKATVVKKDGGWIIDTYVFPYGIGKPVIYLYPNKTTMVSVKVTPDGGLSTSFPAYNDGWVVQANPDGKIVTGGKDYPYLFWEGNSYEVNIPREGTVVARETLARHFDEKLAFLGLNIREAADFKEFWLPRMQEKPYYFVNFVPKSEEDRIAPLDISPKPDSIIRVLMNYRGSNNWYPTFEQHLEPGLRNGFSVVEWGGIFSN